MKRSRDDFDSDSLSSDTPLHSLEGSAEPVKIVHLSQEAAPTLEVMRCSLPGHPELSFSTYDEYESHYNQSHLWKCSECRRNLPSEHYLGLHIQEQHDSMMEVRKERGEKIYACFVEDCDRKCSAPHKRRMHLIDKHLFPSDYDFDIIRTGIDNRSSMLKSGRPRGQSRNWGRDRAGSSVNKNNVNPKKPSDTLSEEEKEISTTTFEQGEQMEEDQTVPGSSTQPDTLMNDLAGAMSSLKFIPTSIRFGRGGGRGKGRGGLSTS